jgi:hypothetical protein
VSCADRNSNTQGSAEINLLELHISITAFRQSCELLSSDHTLTSSVPARKHVMRVSVLAGIAICSILSGCDQATLMKRFTPPDDEASARNYVELLRQGKFDQIQGDLDPSLVDSEVQRTFAKMAAVFPLEPVTSSKVVGAHVFQGQGLKTTDITLEYEFPGVWVLAQVVTRRSGSQCTIISFHVDRIPDSLEELNRFTLVGKSALQYLTLICAVGSFIFALYVFVLSARDRDMKPKWLWMIVTLVGVGRFVVNWGTGQWTYQLIAIQIPSISVSHAPYTPWIVAAYVPLGAIIFLHRRWIMKIRRESTPPVGTHESKPVSP